VLWRRLKVHGLRSDCLFLKFVMETLAVNAEIAGAHWAEVPMRCENFEEFVPERRVQSGGVGITCEEVPGVAKTVSEGVVDGFAFGFGECLVEVACVYVSKMLFDGFGEAGGDDGGIGVVDGKSGTGGGPPGVVSRAAGLEVRAKGVDRVVGLDLVGVAVGGGEGDGAELAVVAEESDLGARDFGERGEAVEVERPGHRRLVTRSTSPGPLGAVELPVGIGGHSLTRCSQTSSGRLCTNGSRRQRRVSGSKGEPY
jgi:hypothetical protein